MNSDDLKSRAKQTSDTLDAIADKAGDALWPRIKSSPFTWAAALLILSSVAYASYKLLGLFV